MGLRIENTMKLQAPTNNCGFTFVELLLVIVIASLVTGALYSAYITQQQSYLAQDQVAEMQQNVRAGMDMMTHEIRMAGFDPQKTANARILIANVGRFQFTQDLNENGVLAPSGANPNENITYGFSNADDANQDGVADAGVASLGRNTGGGFQPIADNIFQPIADNIQAVEFRYLDEDGNDTTVPERIRSVQVSLLARAAVIDPKFRSGGQSFTTPRGAVWGPFNDQFRRRFLTTTVFCRNLGY